MLSFLRKILPDTTGAPKGLSMPMQRYNASRVTRKHLSLCYAPSINMYFSQDGSVKLCCHNMEYSIGRYPEQSIREIWTGAAAEKIRSDMKAYQLYDGCSICREDIELGAVAEVRARHFDTLPVHRDYPTMMEFLLSNTCNLECVMCKGEFSSLIRQNREKLPPIPHTYDDQFIEQLREFIPHLHEARFSGSGEAFLIDVNYKIWELILELNPKCLIMIQTNGMVLNSRIKELLSRGNFQIGVSLDSLTKDVFEAIRPHARLERVLSNIEYFNAYAKSKKIKFSIALCVMRQNWRELPAFINFANSMDATATFHKVHEPVEYSLKGLLKKELEEIADYLGSHSFDEGTYLKRQNARHYEYIISTVREWSKVAWGDFSDEYLLERLLEKMKEYISSDEEMRPEREAAALEHKITSLYHDCDDPVLIRKLLTQLYVSDFKFAYPYFRDMSTAEIIAVSRKQFENTES